MEKLVEVLISTIVGLASAVVQAYTVSKLWLWFVTGFGLPAISPVQVYGLMLVRSAFKGFTMKDMASYECEFSKAKYSSISISVMSLLISVAILAVGYAFKRITE